MPLMKERKISVAGFQLGIATDAQRAERIRRSLLYRYLLRPGLGLLGSRNGTVEVSARPAANPRTEEGPRANGKAAEIWEKVSKIGWYHTIDLGHGIVTPGFIDNRATVPFFGLPDDLTGKRCLDIGTYDGFWALEMERRGASEVVGIDVDSPAEHDIPRRIRDQVIAQNGEREEGLRRGWDEQASGLGLQYPGEGFSLAKEILGSKMRREALNVYDLSPEKLGMFDVVMISQLLLRLRDPQTVLENMFSVCRGIAIVGEPFEVDLEDLHRPVSEFVGTTELGVWWRHSIKSMRKMMEVAGFERIEEVSKFIVENRAGKFWKVILKGHTPAAVLQS